VLLLLLAMVVAPAASTSPARDAAAVAPASRPAATPRPILSLGSRGPWVRRAQSSLSRHGYQVPVTGYYGSLTARQVRRFQAAHGIRATGKVGPLTWPKLVGRGGGQAARPTPTTRPAPAGSAGEIYLTFDDGPDPVYTPLVLELLARYRARATFFVLGRAAATHPELVRQEFAAGHGVGNHTWSHRRLAGLGGGQLEAEVGSTSAAISRATGAPTRCLRAPAGVVDAASADRAQALGMRLVEWDVDTYDWRRPGAGVIAGRVLSGARSGAVVLLHDGGGNRDQTVAALEQVLPSLSARGFRFSAMCRD
jgi:peptidoglycan-N-acetylglucosamine deacetylase